MKVKDLRKELEKFDDETEVILEAEEFGDTEGWFSCEIIEPFKDEMGNKYVNISHIN